MLNPANNNNNVANSLYYRSVCFLSTLLPFYITEKLPDHEFLIVKDAIYSSAHSMYSTSVAVNAFKHLIASTYKTFCASNAANNASVAPQAPAAPAGNDNSKNILFGIRDGFILAYASIFLLGASVSVYNTCVDTYMFPCVTSLAAFAYPIINSVYEMRSEITSLNISNLTNSVPRSYVLSAVLASATAVATLPFNQSGFALCFGFTCGTILLDGFTRLSDTFIFNKYNTSTFLAATNGLVNCVNICLMAATFDDLSLYHGTCVAQDAHVTSHLLAIGAAIPFAKPIIAALTR